MADVDILCLAAPKWETVSYNVTLKRGFRFVLCSHVDQGSLSTNHELASQTHHQMPMF